MAGNVKEWCSTETNRGRFLVGGAWNETKAQVRGPTMQGGPSNGRPSTAFGLAKYIRPLPPALVAPVGFESLVRDARKEQPVGDDIFEVYRRQYAYDSTPLNAVEEATEETAIWRRHTVVIDAAYDGERMRAHLFLPKHGFPAVPDGHLLSTGRRFVLPSQPRPVASLGGASSFAADERFSTRCTRGPTSGVRPDTNGDRTHERELTIAWSRDLGRAIDYLGRDRISIGIGWRSTA